MRKYIFTVLSKEQNITVKLTAWGNSYQQAKRNLQVLIGIEDIILEEKNDTGKSG